MSNIIDIDEAGWKSADYLEATHEGEIHQHRVKVADYVAHRGTESEMAQAESETSYIGAYEYAPGGWITEHSHANAEQWYYVQSGQGLMKVGDEERVAQAGCLIFVPRDTAHSYQVLGDEPLRFLNVAIFMGQE